MAIGRLADPATLIGIHVNWALADPAKLIELGGPNEEEQRSLARLQRFSEAEGGYAIEQGTRPQTLAYGLTDSPVGQLAWIVEKFKEWTDSTDRPEDAVSRDQMLTNVSLYWLTSTAGSSAQLYYESEHLDADFGRTWAGPWPLAMPVAGAVFPKDASRPSPRRAGM